MKFDLFGSLRLCDFALVFFAQIFSIFGLAQVPLAEIEGRLSIHLPEDTTSVHIGKDAGTMQDLESLRSNTFVGSGAGESTQLGFSNSFFGKGAGRNNQDGEQNCYFGEDSGKDIQNGNSNSFYGFSSGAISQQGNNNSFFGAYAGLHTFSDHNVFIGSSSGRNNINGSNNTALGSQSFRRANYTGSYNTAIGDSSMYHVDSNGESVGEHNTALGAGSLHSGAIMTSTHSTALGYQAGYDGGSNSVFVGYQAGKGSASVDNRLYIANRGGDDPLIYGEFDNEFVKVSGHFEVSDFARLKPLLSAPDCNQSSHVGRVYYDLIDDKIRVCVTVVAGVSYQWEDLN